jgi:hypothetical protein
VAAKFSVAIGAVEFLKTEGDGRLEGSDLAESARPPRRPGFPARGPCRSPDGSILDELGKRRTLGVELGREGNVGPIEWEVTSCIARK